MTKTPQKLTIIIPCYNEEEGIGSVIRNIPLTSLRDVGIAAEIIVIDNNSTDNTAEVARAHGAHVIHEPKKGKGNAIRTAFYSLSEHMDFVVMLDGDDTYQPKEILRLIEPLRTGFCSVVVGSRLHGKIAEGSMKRLNLLGNHMYTSLVRMFYGVQATDVLTGYYAWTMPAIRRLRPHLNTGGFAIEMEMMTKMAKLGEEIYSVPISYNARSGESNLNPVRDGIRILHMLMRNLYWKPDTSLGTESGTSDILVTTPAHV